MARTAFVALACGVLGAASALEVTYPSSGEVVIADRTYTVEWTGTSANQRFEIDLYYCGSYCAEDDCGEWVTALCPYGEDGCPDNMGDYDIVMPEPMSGEDGDGYKVRVQNVNSESEADCSDSFTLMASDDVVLGTGDVEPYLMVTSPAEGDSALAGVEYTVEWDYDNGFGSAADRFSIALYLTEGSGDCGTYYANICDKPSIGCKDSMGNYDVWIPEDTPEGTYSIRVGLFDNDALFGCSDDFEIVNDDEDSSYLFY